MGRELSGAEGGLVAAGVKRRPRLASIVLAAVGYNSVFAISGFSSGYWGSFFSALWYYWGGAIVCSCLSIVLSVFLDWRIRTVGRVSWQFVLILSFIFAAAGVPALWIMLHLARLYIFPNFLISSFISGVTTFASWSILHLCIRSAESAVDQERKVAALRETVLRYEHEALSYTLDSNFFLDSLTQISLVLNDGGGIIAGEVVMSLAGRMRAVLAPRESAPESIDEAFVGSIGRAESGAMTDASLRRWLVLGAFGVWASFFFAAFMMDIVDGRRWWKSLSDYGGQAVVGALWFVVGARLLQRAAINRVHVLYLVIFGICVFGICACAGALFLSFALRGDLAWPPLAGWIFGFELNSVMPLFIGWAAMYLLIDARRREIARLNAAAQIREAALNARNAMLRLQVNPHFLFNTLNALYALILDRQFERARGMIAAVRRFLDRAGDPASGELVALSRELATQEAYLEIERVRFGDRLRVDRRIDVEVVAAKVPHLILQPLVENAVKYAVARTDRPVAVEIRARRADRELVLEVSDTGAPEVAPQPPGLGVGLRNVEARLKSLYGEAARLACRPLEPTGFLAEVRLPLSL